LCHNHEVRFDDFSGGSKELAVRSTEDCGGRFPAHNRAIRIRGRALRERGWRRTTSYQLSFIGTVSRASIGIDQRFQAGQFVSSELDLFENNTAPRRGGEKTPRIGRSASAVAQACKHARGSFATSMLGIPDLAREKCPPTVQPVVFAPSASVIHARVPGGLSRRPRFMLSAPLGCSCLFAYHLRGLFPAV